MDTLCFRVKYKKITVFVEADRKNTIEKVKEEFAKSLKEPKKPQEIRLYSKGVKSDSYTILSDKDTVASLELEDDQVLFATFFVDGQWETVKVIEPEPLEELDLDEYEEEPSDSEDFSFTNNKGKSRA
ncbi:hypothetical protein K493DRAFT_307091 [Basidiobolus meristosporus CBS 931.73]|uniref:Ubiquitin-like domain-containing protein n=1 Tax=Basidiobolus meristosporus CBS 931.73 TaxID=1314790 RepID=A0A1Y1XKL4_9FUNG|nr:hypothetical protein K493DRAFT_307091 [Basidiobolus meristosporus CBS 931.73]|eukprot:ORX86309.1 hypothetical protein K493DRAFT_307091 [Basidiobolus meristosporus CBS 931.73]